MMSDSILVDVSVWQGDRVDYHALAAADVVGAIAKCAHGAKGTDATFARNWRASKAAGLIRGAYLWLVPEQDPIEQVDHALDVIDKAGGMDARDLTLSIDFEQKTSITGRRLIDIGERAVRHACDQTGRRVVQFYTGKWYWAQFCLDLDSDIIAAQDYWHAEYPSMRRGLAYDAALRALGGPHLAKPYASRGIAETLWQFDGNGGLYLPGDIDDADFSRYRGTRANLEAHVAGTILARAPAQPDTLPAPPDPADPGPGPTLPGTRLGGAATLLRAGDGGDDHRPADLDEEDLDVTKP